MRENKKHDVFDEATAVYSDEFEGRLPDAAPAPPEEGDTEFRLIGKRTPRLDGRKVVTGSAPYTQDIRLKDMLIGKILRSPHAKAEIVSVDLTKATALKGVKAALQLTKGQVNFAGQQVAAVAAVDEKTAEKALSLIEVEYNPLPFVVNESKSMEEGAPQVYDDRPNVHAFSRDYSRGDVEAGFRQADVKLERTYRTSIEIHHPAETHSSIARWDGDRLTVWDSTQGVHSVRNALASTLGMPFSKVKVIKHYMGGGFGSKLGLSNQTVAAARLAKKTGRPVKILLSRRDNALCVGNRPSTIQQMKGGVKKDGTITALDMTNYTSGGLGRGDGSAVPFIEVYRCENCSFRANSVYLNTGASRPMRAPGHTQGTFGHDGFMDELAAAIDMDPLEFRRKNYTTKSLGGTGLPYSSKGLDRCYDLGAEAIGWQRRNTRPGEGNGMLRRGIGMATQIWGGAGTPGTLADLMLYPDGSVEIKCGTQDIGCGTRTHMAVVAAETLGMDPEDIAVKLGDSDYPYAPISGGSLTTPSVAPAVRDAALKAAEHLKQMAARRLEVPAENLVLRDKKLFDPNDPEKTLDYQELFRGQGRLRRETIFHGERKGLPQGYAYNSFGAHFVEVEVDAETGRIAVIKYVAAHEVGRVINRQTAESQVVGGVTQGISATLFEQRICDDTTGNLVNANLRDYKIITSLDIPEIVPIFVDMVDPRINILGTKGLGEPPRIPVSGAIGNAVYNAIGVPIREIPMTPDKVLAALKNKEAGQ
jgi:xanthine dehydrogenase YagR molybdenum-binding subunit